MSPHLTVQHDSERGLPEEENRKPGKSWSIDPPPEILSYDGPADVFQNHAFNERASNSLPSNRIVPDTRDEMFVALESHFNLILFLGAEV